MSELAVDAPPEPDRLAVVIPFPAERRRSAEAEARRRHPSARTS